jgi:hypothetical protein
MADRSKIRFNPTTGEIEVEGTEAFVKKYYELLSASPRATWPKHPKGTSGPAKKGGRVTTNTDTILQLIRNSKSGITTPDLSGKTGLTDKQIWPIVYKAEKQGKIKKAARGRYVAA